MIIIIGVIVIISMYYYSSTIIISMMMMKIEKDLFNTPQCYCIWKAMKTPFALTDLQDQMDEALQFRQGFRLPGRVAQSQV